MSFAVFWQEFIPALALAVCVVGVALEALRMRREHVNEEKERAIARFVRRHQRKALGSEHSPRAGGL